jgi:acyl phosphate:glycerol-3-phosphate acyltransferase
MFQACLIAGAIAYLFGSIPFGLLLLRIFRGVDVRETGSGNIGAANVARVAPALGLATLVLDAAKGLGAVVVAKIVASHWSGLDARQRYIVLGTSAICSILGHVFSLWLKFHGGKGVATGMGAFLALLPKTMLIALLLFAIIFMIFRYSSLASITAALLFPLLAYLTKERGAIALMPFLCAVSVLTLLKHHENIRRLLAGTERRFTFRH